jgi:hypothetical protein
MDGILRLMGGMNYWLDWICRPEKMVRRSLNLVIKPLNLVIGWLEKDMRGLDLDVRRLDRSTGWLN